MPRHFHPTRTSTLLFCTLLGLAIPAAAQPLTDTLRLCIPSLPLGDALVELGRQSGLEISFPPDAVANKMSPVVRGRFPARLALDQMLEGSGLALRADGENRYIIYADKPDPASTSRLEPVRVYGDQVGERLYDQQEIAATPSSNRDLSTLVANHPAVRANPGAAGSRNRGSLDVEDISFHGASPYQNLFQIDGIDATNRVDPANKQLAQVGGNVPSNPQSYFIDTSLLEAVQVRDSFVPVEYGRFNGGVVDARLRRFSGENHLKFDYRWNTSNMTRQRISPGQEKKWAQGEPGFTPRWQKRFYSAVADIAVNDKAGMVLSLSHRQSRIERWGLTADDAGKPLRAPHSYRDRIDNLLGKFSVRASGDTLVDLTLKYSDRSESLVSNTARDTQYDNNHGAYGLAVRLEHRLPAGRLTVQTGWDHAMSNRRSTSREWVTTRPYNRPLYLKGGFGREQKQQDTVLLKARIDLDPLRSQAFTHNVYAGIDAQQVDAAFKRPRLSTAYTRVYDSMGDYVDTNMYLWRPGTVRARSRTAALYLSDRVEWRRLALDAGLRYDHESLFGSNNLAPRTRLDWDVFGSGDTLLSGGWSRYFGGAVLETALEARRLRLLKQLTDFQGKPVPAGEQNFSVDYSGLRMPYDDEWALSLRQRMMGLEGLLGYVRRNGRQQWTKSGRIDKGFKYRNGGRSITDAVSLTLRTLEPWHAGPTRWTMQASWGWQKRKTNSDLAKGYGDDARGPDERVIYNGAEIRVMDLPPRSYHQPQTATLALIGTYPATGLTWSNTINWHGRHDGIMFVGRGPEPHRLDSYRSVRLSSYWTWDTRLTWQPTVMPRLELTVDILNLLNRMPAVVASNPNLTTNYGTYQSGREVWVQVGYRF
ncbi:TonB-dependent receptor [Achromobacter xylosoxidans]|uniref:TonB-dependent receptor n=1 Tax=Alcaligenes xylosoxydans xylosoxydans TaxID=85698 RepID=UPI0012AA5804|nr:TonB-dependent receptor [Achromobacter xylosoxidans]CUR69607.1 Ferripyoverdine receptor precursor [Achromobacter xylosoxidans]